MWDDLSSRISSFVVSRLAYAILIVLFKQRSSQVNGDRKSYPWIADIIVSQKCVLILSLLVGAVGG
jgi:hypothetical protein